MSDNEFSGIRRASLRHPPNCDVHVSVQSDGNQISALIGRDLVEGVVGFGDTLAEALRDLADAIEREVLPGRY